MKKAPTAKNIILDTDIGCDIDDTWALCHLLHSPELNLKLVTTVSGSAAYRARIVAKILTAMKRTDVAIGIGLNSDMPVAWENQRGWVADYDLDSYAGPLSYDGVDTLIRTIEETENPTVICIGPLLNIEQLCLRRPDLCPKVDLIAMAGSIRKSHRDTPGQIAEWNIQTQIPAAQTVFSANWKSVTITPLDTCGNVILSGDLYNHIKQSTKTLAKTVLANYRVWRKTPDRTDETESSILFDTVAVFLAYSHDFLSMKMMNIEIDYRGFMLFDTPNAKPVLVALDWTDLDAYKKHLTSRIAD